MSNQKIKNQENEKQSSFAGIYEEDLDNKIDLGKPKVIFSRNPEIGLYHNELDIDFD